MLSAECMADLDAAVAEASARLKGKVAGFQRGEAELIKSDSGALNEAAILRETHFECYHCGECWLDTPGLRARLDGDGSVHYVSARQDALPENVGFNFPQWINRRLAWGPMMLAKLKAQRDAQEYGNFLPLKQWWQKVAARSWDDHFRNPLRHARFEVGIYETDPAKLSYGANTHCRQLTVDTGKSPFAEASQDIIGKLFFEVRDFSKQGNSRQLARGMVEDCVVDGVRVSAWELLKAQQVYWKIPARRVFVDAAWMPSQVIEAAVKFFEMVPPNGKLQLPSTWRLCVGSPYKKVGLKGKPFVQEPVPGGSWSAHDAKGQVRRMVPQRVTWSNYWFEDQLEKILLGATSVEWEILSQDKLVIAGLDGLPNAELTRKYVEFEQDDAARSLFRSWQSGLNSRVLDPVKRKYEDLDKKAHAKGHWTEPRDCSLMQLVGVAEDGLLGHVGATEPE